jgi:hypothetical protein
MTHLIRSKRPTVDLPDTVTFAPQGTARRKPRIMVAGEFSAGKTRLITGLLGSQVLPSNVTATSLPPVWLISGNETRSVVNLDGAARDVETLEGISVEDTHFCLLSTPSPFLERFDIIDTPGNSDPNIPSESWERMLGYADAVIWCTNATQAWRQSEKSVWNEMPDHLRQNATILITHADRLPDDRAAQRVLRRVKREAGAYFSSFLIASLLYPDDIRRIAEHLDTVAEGLDELPGEDNNIVEAFASSAQAAAVKLSTATATIRPRRIIKSAAGNPVAEAPVEDLSTATPAVDVAVETRPDLFHLTQPITDVADAPAAEVEEQVDLADDAGDFSETVAAVLPDAADLDLEDAVELSDDEAEESFLARVHRLSPAVAEPEPDSDADIAEKSPARLIWGDLTRDTDMTDAAEVLTCVEQLLAALERPQDILTETTFENSDDEDIDLSVIQSVMSRRKP